MARTVKHDIKDLIKVFKDMAIWENLRFTLLFVGVIIATPLVLFALGFVSKEFYEYVSKLYEDSSPGDRLNIIVTLFVFAFGLFLGRFTKRDKKKSK